MFFEVAAMLFGQFAAATSIIMIKASSVPPGYLGAYRLFFAALIFAYPGYKQYKRRFNPQAEMPEDLHGPGLKGILKYALLPGVFLGLHFFAWNMGARLTLAANATLLVNMIPLVMPILMFLFYRLTLSPREVAGSVIALLGVFVLSSGSVQISTESVLGDLLCFLAMLFLALYLVFAKGAQKARIPLLTYLTWVYFIGAITAFIINMPFSPPAVDHLLPPQLWYILGLTAVPTILGHSLMNRAMQTLSSQLVSIGQLSQFIWAALLAFLFFGEIPETVFYPASLLVLLGAGLTITSHWQKKQTTRKVRQ